MVEAKKAADHRKCQLEEDADARRGRRRHSQAAQELGYHPGRRVEMAQVSTFELLQRRAAMKIVVTLPEKPQDAIAILNLARELIEWKPKA